MGLETAPQEGYSASRKLLTNLKKILARSCHMHVRKGRDGCCDVAMADDLSIRTHLQEDENRGWGRVLITSILDRRCPKHLCPA